MAHATFGSVVDLSVDLLPLVQLRGQETFERDYHKLSPYISLPWRGPYLASLFLNKIIVAGSRTRELNLAGEGGLLPGSCQNSVPRNKQFPHSGKLHDVGRLKDKAWHSNGMSSWISILMLFFGSRLLGNMVFQTISQGHLETRLEAAWVRPRFTKQGGPRLLKHGIVRHLLGTLVRCGRHDWEKYGSEHFVMTLWVALRSFEYSFTRSGRMDKNKSPCFCYFSAEGFCMKIPQAVEFRYRINLWTTGFLCQFVTKDHRREVCPNIHYIWRVT